MRVWIAIYLSISPTIYQDICVSTPLPVYQSTYPSMCLSICLSACLPLPLPADLSIHPFIYLSAYTGVSVDVGS